MLKRFWKWLWPDKDLTPPIQKHNWGPWSMSEEMGQQFFGGSYRIQRRRCLDCSISQEVSLSNADLVPCTKVN